MAALVVAMAAVGLPGGAWADHVEVSGDDGLATAVRWSGETRFDTAAKLAVEGTAAAVSTPANAAILATGRDFPDALAGSYLSGAVGGPILLTERDTIPAETLSRLTGPADSDLDIDTVYLLGGPVAISEAVANQVRGAGFEVVRLAGENRIETAAKIATTAPGATVGRVNGLRTAIVATASNFPDALVAGAASRAASLPLLLTNGATLSPEASTALSTLQIQQVLIAGGPVAVATGVEDALRLAGYQTRRIQGENRNATAVAFAEFNVDTLGFTEDQVGLARNNNFPDALAFAPFAGRERMSILLTAPDLLPPDTSAHLSSLRSCTFDTLYVPGGPVAVTPAVVAQARALLTAPSCAGVDNKGPELQSARLVPAAASRALPDAGDDYVVATFDEAVTCSDAAPVQFTHTAGTSTTVATSLECDGTADVVLGFPAGTIDPDAPAGTVRYLRAGDPAARVVDGAGNQAVSPAVSTAITVEPVVDPSPTPTETETEDGALVVDSTDDQVDAAPGDGVCAASTADGGDCTLRAAIQEANAGDADTITVGAGTYTLSLAGAEEDAAATGDLDVTADLTITGAGAGLVTIDGDGIDRVFDVFDADLEMSDVTVTGGAAAGIDERMFNRSGRAAPTDDVGGGGLRVTSGNVSLAGVGVMDNEAVQWGGGIAVFDGTVTLASVDLSDNTSGVIDDVFGAGGGLYADDATVTMTGTSVSGNTTSGDGGGLALESSTFVATDLLMTDNLAIEGRGGGIDADESSITVDGASNFLGNSGDGGGAVSLDDGALDVTGATFDSNTSADTFDANDGGAVRVSRSDATINDSVLSNNTAEDGGALIARNSSVELVGVQLRDNVATDQGGALWLQGTALLEDVDGAGAGQAVNDANVLHIDNSPDGGTVVQVLDTTLTASAGAPDIDTCSQIVGSTPPNSDDDDSCFVEALLVNSATDAIDADVGDGFCSTTAADDGPCSLRAAVQEADAADDDGVDAVYVPAGTYPLTINGAGDDTGAAGDLDLSTIVRLTGAGADVVTVDASSLGDRVFDVASGDHNISGITITGGTANASPDDRGGGIRVVAGALRVAFADIVGNVAPLAGGGIENTGGDLTVVATNLTDNQTTGAGGGGNGGAVHAVSNSLVRESSIDGNTAVEGGGVWVGGGASLDIEATDMTDNVAVGTIAGEQGGGAAFNDGATLDISDGDSPARPVISGNRATGHPVSGGAGSGGAVMSVGGTANTQIQSVDLVGNVADRAGGAVEQVAGRLEVFNVNVRDNVATGATSAGNGGGVHSTTPVANQVQIFGGQFIGNSAVEGGALWAGGPMNVIFTTFEDNTASEEGGAFYDETGPFNFDTVIATSGNRETDGVVQGNVYAAGGVGGGTTTAFQSRFFDAAGEAEATCETPISADGDANVDDDGTCFPNADGDVFLVDVEGDTPDAAPGDGTCADAGGACTLRAAVEEANGDVDKDRLNVQPGTYVLTAGALAITEDVVIDGLPEPDDGSKQPRGIQRGPNAVTIDAGGASRIFEIDAAIEVEIDQVDLLNGSAPGAADKGGAVRISGGADVLLQLVSVADSNAGLAGGAIDNANSLLEVRGGAFVGNTAGSNGGAFHVSGASVTTLRAAFDDWMFKPDGNARADDDFSQDFLSMVDNTAGAEGGAVWVGDGSSLTASGFSGFIIWRDQQDQGRSIQGSFTMFDGNTAVDGGGLYLEDGADVDVLGAAFARNTATGDLATNGGGAIFVEGGVLSIENALVGMDESFNTTRSLEDGGNAATGAAGSGGGLFIAGGTVGIEFTQFMGNTANRAGGAIEMIGGDLSMQGDVFSDFVANVAGPVGTPNPGNGGALHQTAGTSNFDRVEAANNVAASEGGAFWVGGTGAMTLFDSSLYDNTAGSAGGALYNDGGTMTLDSVFARSGQGDLRAARNAPTGNIYAQDDANSPSTDTSAGNNDFASTFAGATCSALIGIDLAGNNDDDGTCFQVAD